MSNNATAPVAAATIEPITLPVTIASCLKKAPHIIPPRIPVIIFPGRPKPPPFMKNPSTHPTAASITINSGKLLMTTIVFPLGWQQPRQVGFIPLDSRYGKALSSAYLQKAETWLQAKPHQHSSKLVR